MTQKTTSISTKLPVSPDFISRRVRLIRGKEIMLSGDLADLYQVSAKVFNQAVRRNTERFPDDFMFSITYEEASFLRSQTVTLEKGRGKHSKYLPLAFTEHGVAMLSAVLKSDRAIKMSILIIRAFIQLRKMTAEQHTLSKRLQKAEGTIKLHGQVLAGVVEDIKKIKNPPKTNAIGFRWKPKNT